MPLFRSAKVKRKELEEKCNETKVFIEMSRYTTAYVEMERYLFWAQRHYVAWASKTGLMGVTGAVPALNFAVMRGDVEIVNASRKRC